MSHPVALSAIGLLFAATLAATRSGTAVDPAKLFAVDFAAGTPAAPVVTLINLVENWFEEAKAKLAGSPK